MSNFRNLRLNLLPVTFLIFILAGRVSSQTLEMREICNLNYKTDFASLLEKNKDSLFPSSSTLGAVHFYRGLSLLEQGNYHNAIADFRVARTDSTVSRTFCNFYIGVAFMQLRESDSILSICSQALNVPAEQLKNIAFWQNSPVSQDRVFASYLLGTNEVMTIPEDSNLVNQLFSYATGGKSFYEAYVNYATWCLNTGQFKKSIDLLNKAREEYAKEDSLILLCMGFIYRLAGDPGQSEKAYILLISKYRTFAAAYNNLGCLYAFLEKYKKGISKFSKAIRKDPRLVDALCNRGLVNLKLERFQEAFEDFTLAIQVNGRLADAYYYRGFARKGLGDVAGSVLDYTRAIELKK